MAPPFFPGDTVTVTLHDRDVIGLASSLRHLADQVDGVLPHDVQQFHELLDAGEFDEAMRMLGGAA